MTDPVANLATLSPEEKRALLAKLLIEKARKSKTSHPISHNQREMWFIHQFAPVGPALNIAFAIRLHSTIELIALKSALQTLIERHPTLRTTYGSEEGVLLQYVHGYMEIHFEQIDASTWDWETLDDRIRANYKRPFNLETGPMMRASLFTRAATDHILLLTVHHIAADGWSIWLLFDELRSLYPALKEDSTADLPLPKVTYSDFARWQDGMLNSTDGEEHWAYWQQLGRELPVLNLQTDQPRPSRRTYDGSSYTFSLGKELTQQIKRLIKAEGITMYTVLLAAYHVLLYRYTGQRDILVGSVMSGRTRPEFARVVGCFINVVLLRGYVANEITFREFLPQVRNTILGAMKHQDYPLQVLTNRLQLNRDVSRIPLVQANFILQTPQQSGDLATSLLSPDDKDIRIDFGGLEIASYYLPQQEGQLELSLEMIEGNDELLGVLKYNSDLFDASTIRRMVRHFQTILEGAVANPDQRVDELPLTTADEQQQLLVEWNDTTMDFPKEKCFPELFEAQVQRTPDAVAAVCEGEQITYDQLNKRANRLARILVDHNVGPDTVVALLDHRGIQLLTAILAVFKASGAYLPLDPSHPSQRISQILQQSQSPLVLVAQEFEPKIEQSLANLLPEERPNILQFEAVLAQEGDEANLPLRCTPDHLAYVIFTSGSTGVPKGAMVEQLGMINHLYAKIADLTLTKVDRVAQTASQCFDISVWQFLAELIIGGQVYIYPNEITYDPTLLIRSVANDQISILETVPSMMRAMLDSVAMLGDSSPNLTALRWLVPTGEALPPELSRQWFTHFPNVPLINAYGPTECSDDVTHYAIYKPPPPDVFNMPIGRPIQNMRMYVLDQMLQPLPIGVPGELYVGGIGVGRGYLNDKNRTADAFLSDPFSQHPGARLYKTGDLVRYLADGNLEFLGRLDFQVKIRGFRIELGEIETALEQHPQVREVVVVAQGDAPDEKRLVSYITSNEPGLVATEFKEYLKDKLPNYMIPSAVMILDKLPLTPNGKVDRQALPEPDATVMTADYTPPQTDVEQAVATIWQNVLDLNQVSIDDNFFDLGGHSLLMMQVQSRLHEQLQVDVPIVKLFQHPTILALSRYLEQARLEQGSASRLPKPASMQRLSREKTTGFPLSFAQERLWLLDQFEPGLVAYNLPSAIRIRGNLDTVTLRQTLTEIVRRHEVLRTTFSTANDEPVQVIHPPATVELPVEDLRTLPADDQLRVMHEFSVQEAQHSFDLAEGPLLRVKLLQLSTDEYIILLTMHHIVADGWSLGVLIHEFAAIYTAIVNDSPSPLPPLHVQYADFAYWQREWLQGEVLDNQLAYWKQQLSGDIPVLDSLLERPRPPIQTYDSETETLKLPAALSQSLQKLSQAEGTTLFMVLLAAFKLLLHRYTGLVDIAIGSPIAGRNRTETEHLIGFFLNTLVLRTDLSGDITFQDLLNRVCTVALDAFDNQDIPFEKILAELQPERNLSHTPLFQVFFNMINLGTNQIELPGLTMEPVDTPEIGSKFDLTLYAFEYEQSINLRAVYNSDLFTRKYIATLLRHFEYLLNQIVANPQQSITSYPLMSESDQQKLEVTIPPSELFVPFTLHNTNQSIAERFLQIAELHPDHLAIKTSTTQLTYAELCQAASQVAAVLNKTEVAQVSQVCLLVEHDISMIVAMFGALLAGKTYIPLDPTYPQRRLQNILVDSQASIILTNDRNLALANTLVSESIQLINLDTQPIQSNRFELPPVDPETLAYILYTSGSTGQPKGVMQSHRNVLLHIRNYTNNLCLDRSDRLTLLSSYSFDASVMAIYGALLNGATLYPYDVKQMGIESMADWLNREEITIYHSTPTLYRHFLNTLPDEMTFPNVRAVVLGGEAVQRRDVAFYRKHFSQTSYFINGLGPTESTLALQNILAHDTPLRWGSVPVGYPVEGMELLLLDEEGQLTPLQGEIALRATQVALGYWQQPELTALVFHPDPTDQSKQIYHTGDLGRWLPDGRLEFLGRLDFQVKIRGFRIELGEIETALEQHPQVREAVVLSHEDRQGNAQLIAYLVPDPARPPETSEIRGYLQKHLPDYMIPSNFVLLDALPLTPNRKLDLQALPEPELQPAPSEIFAAPQTQPEELVAEIWAEVLGLEKIGRQDDFFELGGHSLLATQIISRVQEVMQTSLPLRSLFEAPTVAGMVENIQAIRRDNPLTTAPPMIPVARNGGLPLSFSQERMWFLYQLAPESAAYHMPSGVRIHGPLDLQALENSFNAVIQRHEILRTAIVTDDGIPMQIASSEISLDLSVLDLQAIPEAERLTRAISILQTETIPPFDLSRPPLMRTILLKLDDEDHIIGVVVHHIISDLWSLGVLSQELVSFYNAYATGEAASLPELPIQYADFAQWQRRWLQGDILEGQLSYWKQKLEGLSVFELPTDKPRPAIQTFNGARQLMSLPLSLIEKLRRLSRQEQVTHFMLLLSVFKVLLFRYSGQNDIAVGTPIANRTWQSIEGLIGTFVNTLVFRTELSSELTFRELLAQVRETALEAYAHQDLPFEKIVDELVVERDTSHAPIVQVLFNVQNVPVRFPTHEDISFSPVRFDWGTTQFDLMLSVNTQDFPHMLFIYNTDLFTEATITRMMEHMRILLGAVVTDIDQRILELPLLVEAEKQQLLVKWNDTQVDYRNNVGVHQLFVAQAERTPEQTAVIFGEDQLTYQELNERANQLAHHLRALGVGSGALVGICVERSLEMVIGVLGVLKAGAGFVPLDPAFPKQRLEYMVEDAQIAVLLTQNDLVTEIMEPVDIPIVCLDSDWSLISWNVRENPPKYQADRDSLAYIIYTSGSTGKPKGVEIPHQSVVNLLESMQQETGVTTQDKLIAVTTLSFDISILEIFLPLITGAQLLLVTRETAADGRQLIREISDSAATIMQATPTTWRMLIQSGWQGGKLKVLSGGEVLPRDLANQLVERCDSLWNAYGPTETTIYSTIYQVTQGNGTVPIGRPIANTQVYVLDAYMQPVPIGVPGELYIGGDGVALGYRNKPTLTSERFLPDPFNDKPGARIYRTGDLVRYLPDGNIEFLGRMDHQVKIRGFRIELDEIETILAQHPAVQEVVVVAREDMLGNKTLAAYIIPQSGVELPSTKEWRAFAALSLPDYMIPSAFAYLNSFPLTPNKKVDRKALPIPEMKMDEQTFVAPRNSLELQLTQIWQDILGTRPIGMKDNFFDLGGHSLMAVRLFSRIEETLGVNLPLATLFREATIEHLAEGISQQPGLQAWTSLTPIQLEGENLPIYCVHGITGDILWFRTLAERMAPHQPFYGFQSRGLDGIQQPHSNIPDMAAQYVEELCQFQPEGPYFLGGASLGGTIALEMAQQLQAQGKQVALLVIFDNSPPNLGEDSYQSRLGALAQIVKNFPNWLESIRELGFEQLMARLTRKIRLVWKGFKRSGNSSQNDINQFVAAGDLLDDGSELPQHRQELIEENYRAYQKYVPQSYTGRVVLFRAQSRPLLDPYDPENGWRQLTKNNLEVHEIPGSHEGMFKEPRVQVLARLLRESLENAANTSAENARH